MDGISKAIIYLGFTYSFDKSDRLAIAYGIFLAYFKNMLISHDDTEIIMNKL